MPSNRLFFPTMVQRQLKKNDNPAESSVDIFSELDSLEQESLDYPERSIESSFNSIIASVHQNLNELRLAKANAAREARERAAKKERHVIENDPAPVSNVNLKKGPAKSDISFEKSLRSGSRSMGLLGNLSQYNTRSISQIKASFEQKLQQRMRRNIGRPNEVNNFTNQQRLKEVLRQRRMLEDILCEHERIQRDRNSIAHEIEMMKDYLNEIRFKLDTSLKKLSKTPLKNRRVPTSNRPSVEKSKRNTWKLVGKGESLGSTMGGGSKYRQSLMRKPTKSAVTIETSLIKNL